MLDCCCPDPLDDGAPISGSVEVAFDTGEIITTDATVQTVVLGRLPVDGAQVHINVETIAEQSNGQRGAWSLNNATAARNVNGSNSTQHITLLQSYTDVVTPPWTTVAAGAMPAGWAFVAPTVAGTDFQIQFNGAAGQTISWRIYGSVVLQRGATP